MRCYIDNQEVYVFKDVYYRRDSSVWYYGSDKNSNLADKHFLKCSNYRTRDSENFKSLIELAITSPKAPILKSPPKVEEADLTEQLNEFLRYWEENFDIKMDDKGRFFKTYRVFEGFNNKNTLRVPGYIVKTKYYSFEVLLQVYNADNRHLSSLLGKYADICKAHVKATKKYAYVTLVRTRKGFRINSKTVITYPS